MAYRDPPATSRLPATDIPYWRLSNFYFFYFAALGALLPYWSLYLQSIEFDATAIGQLTAILVGSKIIAPNIWGWIADHHGRGMFIIKLGSFIAALAFAGALFTTSFWGLALVMLLFGFFWNATLPQFEVTTLNHLGESSHAYSMIRVWGSIGFIVTVWFLGFFFERQSIDWLPEIMLILMSMIFLSSLFVFENRDREVSGNHDSLFKTLKKPPVLALIAACFLMQASHAPYYTFYSIYLEEHDYSRSFIGQMWALGVVAEVFIFLYMTRLNHRFSIKFLLLLSLMLACLRWCMIAVGVDYMSILILAQLLHAASFGLYHACAIQLFHNYFKGSIQGRGQAIYSSMSFGAGLALGSFISGYAWQSFGATVLYFSAALLCFIATIIAGRWVKE